MTIGEQHYEVIPVALLDCPRCWTQGPERTGADASGSFFWVRCSHCDLDFKVSG